MLLILKNQNYYYSIKIWNFKFNFKKLLNLKSYLYWILEDQDIYIFNIEIILFVL